MIQDEPTISAGDLEQRVASVFETMLGVEMRTSDWPWCAEPNRVEASVHLTGSWSGVLILEVSPAQACLLAGRFLSMDPPEAMDNDVRDVLGELANMIGGNLKSDFLPNGKLSLPEVVDGKDFRVRMCGTSVAARAGFECEEGVFWVTLLARKKRLGSMMEGTLPADVSERVAVNGSN